MRYLAAAIPAAFCLSSAFGQTLPDSSENIVVTATRLPDPVANIPAGVTVIDRTTIEQRGYLTLVDALSAVPGLRIVQSGGAGSQASVFVRGTNSNQVLVLRDGIPINDPGDPGGAFNFGSDDLGDVERIEIVRGEMSGLYGSGAIGGVINLITRQGKGAMHGSVTLGGGSPRQGIAAADLAGDLGIWDYSATVEGQSNRGFDQTPQREIPIYTGEVDGDRTKTAQVELGVTPFANTRFSVLLRARDTKYGYDDAGSVPFDGGNATGYDASLYGRFGVNSVLAGGAWTTSATLVRLQDDRRYTVTPDAADPNEDSQDSRYHGRRTDGQWNNVVRLPDWAALTSSDVSFGYEHLSDQAHTKIASSSGGFPYASTVITHDDTDSGNVGAQTTLFGRLVATGQVREDATTVAGNAFTWRLGGVLQIPEISSRLHATYGTSFRAPALFDRYGVDSYGYVGNPNLRPERAQGWEAGFARDFDFTSASKATVSLTYFDNRIRDLIEVIYSPDFTSSTPQNVPSARTRGVEAVVTLQASSWMSADLAYTYTDARNLDTGVQLLRRPYNQGSADVRFTPFPGFTVTPELLYVGQALDFLIDNSGEFGPQGLNRSGLLLNLNITWQITPAVEVFAWAKNLGDSTYEPADGYQTPGTSFMAGTKVRF